MTQPIKSVSERRRLQRRQRQRDTSIVNRSRLIASLHSAIPSASSEQLRAMQSVLERSDRDSVLTLTASPYWI